jgi:hypothetical protein
MTDSPWLIEEITLPSEADRAAIDRARGPVSARGAGRGPKPLVLAITLHDVVIHDVRKWFGGADIRIDSLVVHGRQAQDEQSTYQPRTLRFPGVRDGEKLDMDAGGLLIYYGKTVDFLDISLVVSRNRKDSDDLDSLLTDAVQSGAVPQAAQAIGALALSAGAAALVIPALAGAGAIAKLVYRLIENISGDALGLYHGAWLQFRDEFGIGPHPNDRPFYESRDITFRYEITREKKGQTRQ